MLGMVLTAAALVLLAGSALLVLKARVVVHDPQFEEGE